MVRRLVNTMGGRTGDTSPIVHRLCPSTAASTVWAPVSRSMRTSRRSSEFVDPAHPHVRPAVFRCQIGDPRPVR